MFGNSFKSRFLKEIFSKLLLFNIKIKSTLKIGKKEKKKKPWTLASAECKGWGREEKSFQLLAEGHRGVRCFRTRVTIESEIASDILLNSGNLKWMSRFSLYWVRISGIRVNQIIKKIRDFIGLLFMWIKIDKNLVTDYRRSQAKHNMSKCRKLFHSW